MREWLVTNGLGGYASLTSSHENTRKFHGLLIASLHPPIDRWVFVANCLDHIETKDGEQKVTPSRATHTFSLFPTLNYVTDDVVLQKTFFMLHHHNTSIIRYDVYPKHPLVLCHTPLLTSRHFYTVHSSPCLFDITVDDRSDRITFSPTNTDQHINVFKPEGFSYHQDYRWEYHNYEYDRMRLDSSEDYLINVGCLKKEITDHVTYYLIFSLEDQSIDPQRLYNQEKQRKRILLDQAHLPNEISPLVLASDQFLVKKKKGTTILAGYHWFSDWGRDTLIALPGLTLVTNRYDLAKSILLNINDTCHQGIIPNTYDDKTGDAAYNTVDASLWFIDRVYQYMKYTNDLGFLKQVYPTLVEIIDSYRKGTMYDIHMDDDHLISHGPGLTWMDVKIDDYYPTPRSRKAVEIQGLWYHGLCIMDLFSEILSIPHEYDQIAEKVKSSFRSQYQKQYDIIDTRDDSCRPNKLFLVSLDHIMIDRDLQQAIVSDVEHKLITIFGPRTVSRDHPQYKGSYVGNYPRDITYHNGMVWPWLLGPFITSYLKVHSFSKDARKQAFERFLQPMMRVYGDHWNGAIHEIFDGDPVYAPRGCINQAWSVAEPLRAYSEDILYKRPPYEQQYKLNEVRI
jgi:predicted glycogen debranching enzyme